MSISSHDTMSDIEELRSLAARASEVAERLIADGVGNSALDRSIQELLTAGVRLYVAKRTAEEELTPFVENKITATDVSIVATSMLEAVDLELFELTLWHGWGRP